MNVIKVKSDLMLVLSNVTIELLNVRQKRKKREPSNVTTVKSYVMLILHNVKIESSNVIIIKKGTTKCDKSIIKCDVGTAECDNGIIKCEKRK